MDKNKIIIAAIVIVLLLLGGFLFLANKSSKKQTSQTQETSDAIPTVDSSVQVSVKGTDSNHAVIMTIKGVPQGTESIDYEITYETVEGGLPGISSTVEVKPGQDTVVLDKDNQGGPKLLLGTCSSGKCVYHNVKGPLHINLRFNGSYGQRLYTHDFSL